MESDCYRNPSAGAHFFFCSRPRTLEFFEHSHNFSKRADVAQKEAVRPRAGCWWARPGFEFVRIGSCLAWSGTLVAFERAQPPAAAKLDCLAVLRIREFLMKDKWTSPQPFCGWWWVQTWVEWVSIGGCLAWSCAWVCLSVRS